MKTGVFDYDVFVENVLKKEKAKSKEIIINGLKASEKKGELINDIYEKINRHFFGENWENIAYSFGISLDYVFALERSIEALLGTELENILDENVLGLKKEYWDCVEAHHMKSKSDNPA